MAQKIAPNQSPCSRHLRCLAHRIAQRLLRMIAHTPQHIKAPAKCVPPVSRPLMACKSLSPVDAPNQSPCTRRLRRLAHQATQRWSLMIAHRARCPRVLRSQQRPRHARTSRVTPFAQRVTQPLAWPLSMTAQPNNITLHRIKLQATSSPLGYPINVMSCATQLKLRVNGWPNTGEENVPWPISRPNLTTGGLRPWY